jgi:hypothetical protein
MKWWQPTPDAPIRPVPWLSMAAREYLDNLMQPEWRVAEHGGGGSTLWFASKCQHVTTVENNMAWLKKIAEKDLPNAILVYGRDVPEFAQPLDLILIDGEPPEDRAEWLKVAPEIVKPGGWVVLDNANRPEYAAERKHMQAYAEHVETIDANEGGTMYLVTEFYRLPQAEAESPKPKRKGGKRGASRQ